MTWLRRVEGRSSRWTLNGEHLRLALDVAAGGRAIITDDRDRSFSLSPRVRVLDGSEPLDLLCDGDAEAIPLLQAGGLAGVRSHHTWRRPDGVYIGDGFVECWLGTDLRVSVGVRILESVVVRAGLAVDGAAALVADQGALRWPDGHTISGVARDASTARALDWVRPRPPFYARWMSFVEQWSLDPDAHGLALVLDDEDPAFRYVAKAPDVGLTAVGTVSVRLPGQRGDTSPVMPGRSDPTSGVRLIDLPAGDGGVVVPAGPAGPVVLDIMGQPPGAVVVEADDPTAGVTLVSRAGGIDDPVVPLRRRHDQPSDGVIIVTRRDPARDTNVRIRPARGIHATVQVRDSQRRITIHDDRDAGNPVATVDTAGGRLVDLRLPGGDVAVADLPLHWLRYLGKSASHVADEVTGIDVASWGPEVVDLSLTSRTADGAATSTTRLVVPRREDRLELHVETALKGAGAWRTSTAEFVDVFPEWGIDPGRWRYRHVAVVRRSDTALVDMRDPFPGLDDVLTFPIHALEAYQQRSHVPEYGPWRLAPGDAVLLHGGDPGDVVVTLGPVVPSSLEQVATYCEHWGDVHLDVVRQGQVPTPTEVGRREAALPDEIATAYTLSVLPPVDGGLDAAVARVREELVSGTAEDH